jgi:hypothetical protein
MAGFELLAVESPAMKASATAKHGLRSEGQVGLEQRMDFCCEERPPSLAVGPAEGRTEEGDLIDFLVPLARGTFHGYSGNIH